MTPPWVNEAVRRLRSAPRVGKAATIVIHSRSGSFWDCVVGWDFLDANDDARVAAAVLDLGHKMAKQGLA